VLNLYLLNKGMAMLDDSSRRNFIKAMSAATLGVSLPAFGIEKLLKNPVKYRRAKSVIYVNATGGMSHLDTLDPKPESPEQAGPLKSIKTNVTGVHLSEYLPKLAQCMDKIAVIRSMTSTAGAHEQAQYLMKTGYSMRGTIKHPSMGAWILKQSGWINRELPGYVMVNSSGKNIGNGFMPTNYGALPINDPKSGILYGRMPNRMTDDRFSKRLAKLSEMNEGFMKYHKSKKIKSYVDIYDDAVKMMKSSEFDAFNLQMESEETREKYGSSKEGQGCLLARRLVENGVRCVEVKSTGWDTHDNNFEKLADKCADLDSGLASLIAELHERGMLEETLVVLTTEFGRTPDIFKVRNNGRNHYPKAFSMMMAGGGIVGGQVFGKTNKSGHEVVENPVKFGDINATTAFALGIDPAERIMSPSGRPFVMGHKGKVITELFS
jgi:hypothetical protein